MWPSVWGNNWWWGVLSALGLLAGLFGWVIRLGSPRSPTACPDVLQELWKRYEQGDLTAWEFERLIQANLGQKSALRLNARHSADQNVYCPRGEVAP